MSNKSLAFQYAVKSLKRDKRGLARRNRRDALETQETKLDEYPEFRKDSERVEQ